MMVEKEQEVEVISSARRNDSGDRSWGKIALVLASIAIAVEFFRQTFVRQWIRDLIEKNRYDEAALAVSMSSWIAIALFVIALIASVIAMRREPSSLSKSNVALAMTSVGVCFMLLEMFVKPFINVYL
ncbi:hypothetical protein GCM10009860_14640 [Microbacterium mitrae]|uniref:Uncharacterized protein n=2 Tax=Microbacterium mitrae TaxID=664640 RepID=A0A5C8HNG3_9MICO|nr:hypothetical protein FVP60_11210 [Microbacterium mitrae]